MKGKTDKAIDFIAFMMGNSSHTLETVVAQIVYTVSQIGSACIEVSETVRDRKMGNWKIF